MPKISINPKLGQLKPKVFQEWFAMHFPQQKDEWQSHYEAAGGKVRHQSADVNDEKK